MRGVRVMMTRRPAVLATSMLLLSGCSSGIEQGASDTGSPMQPAGSVSPSATPVSGCPAGSATDQPGPPDQARPNLGVMGVLAAMDTTAERIVASARDSPSMQREPPPRVRRGPLTWAPAPGSTRVPPPPGRQRLWACWSSCTTRLPTGQWVCPQGLAPVCTYDLAGNTWTQMDAEGGGSDWWPIVAYDPDRQQVLAWEHHGLHGAMVKALDLEMGTWAVR